MHPQAFGEDMEVPFMSWFFFRVQFGTEVTAPPGAVIHTPKSPSELCDMYIREQRHIFDTIYSHVQVTVIRVMHHTVETSMYRYVCDHPC